MAAIGEGMTVRSFVLSSSFHRRSKCPSYFYYCCILLFLRNLYCCSINYYCLLFPKSNRTSQSHPRKTSSIPIERGSRYARERKSEFIPPTCPSNPDGRFRVSDGVKGLSVLLHFCNFMGLFGFWVVSESLRGLNSLGDCVRLAWFRETAIFSLSLGAICYVRLIVP